MSAQRTTTRDQAEKAVNQCIVLCHVSCTQTSRELFGTCPAQAGQAPAGEHPVDAAQQ